VQRESLEAPCPGGSSHCDTQIGMAGEAFGGVDESPDVVDGDHVTGYPVIDNGASPGNVGRYSRKPGQPRLDENARHTFTLGERCEEKNVAFAQQRRDVVPAPEELDPGRCRPPALLQEGSFSDHNSVGVYTSPSESGDDIGETLGTLCPSEVAHEYEPNRSEPSRRGDSPKRGRVTTVRDIDRPVYSRTEQLLGLINHLIRNPGHEVGPSDQHPVKRPPYGIPEEVFGTTNLVVSEFHRRPSGERGVLERLAAMSHQYIGLPRSQMGSQPKHGPRREAQTASQPIGHAEINVRVKDARFGSENRGGPVFDVGIVERVAHRLGVGLSATGEVDGK
jgi:hypothetical protein